MTATLSTSELYRLSRDIYSDPSGVLATLSTVRLPKRLPIRGARLAILSRQPFDAGNLTGQTVAPHTCYLYSGRMPTDWARAFGRDVAAGIAYVVYSYATPIGWERADGLRVIPPVSYSNSTARHQGELRAAWNMGWGRAYSHPTRDMSSL